ncbi:hypothetical protein SLE2022_225450 [Rubroshorea leprosula]
MKVSLKLQDERSPVLRAKIPVSIFSQPFVSGLTTATTISGNAESSQNPSFSLATNFPSGPSLKLSYAPSSMASARFSLSLKSGLGLFGSPRNSPLIFCAQFSLPASNPSSINPFFSLHFKPQIGNFSVHKATSSNPSLEPDTGPQTLVQSGSRPSSEFAPDGSSLWQEVKLEPTSVDENGFVDATSSYADGLHSNSGIGFVPQRSLVKKDSKKVGLWGGISVTARTLLPVTKRLVVNFQWSLNLATEIGQKMPYLTVNKIGIERMEEVKEVRDKGAESNAGEVDLLKGMCFWMGRDLETLGRENKELKQCLEEMRQGITARTSNRESESFGVKVPSPLVEKPTDFEQWRSKKNGGEESGGKELKNGANKMNDVESELQKAIKAAAST